MSIKPPKTKSVRQACAETSTCAHSMNLNRIPCIENGSGEVCFARQIAKGQEKTVSSDAADGSAQLIDGVEQRRIMKFGIPNTGDTPKLDIKPRVFVRKAGGAYKEIVGIRSFERSDFESSENNVTFTMSGGQSGEVNDILAVGDKFVDVKMEFELGATMVMTFSGVVEQFSGDIVTFTMSTPIGTEVIDDPSRLH